MNIDLIIKLKSINVLSIVIEIAMEWTQLTIIIHELPKI